MKSEIHYLSLRGTAGIIVAILTSALFYGGDYLVKGFASGDGPIAFLPINFFEILMAAVFAFGILLTYFILVRINKKRVDHRRPWTYKGRSIRIQFFSYNLLGVFCIFLLMHFGEIKWIIPVLFLLFAAFTFNIRKKTLGHTVVLSGIALVSAVLAVVFDTYQFTLAMGYFGIVIFLYSLKSKRPI